MKKLEDRNGNPVMTPDQRKISSLSARIKSLELRCETLKDANEALLGEVETLRKERDKAAKRKDDRVKQNLRLLSRGIERAKKLEAIQMILSGEWVLDTRRPGKKIVKAEDLRYKVN